MEEIIIKYITEGKISNENLQSLKIWLDNPKNKEHFKEIVKTNQQFDVSYLNIDIEDTYEKIRKASEHKKPKTKPHTVFFKYAATILIFISISYGTYSIFFKDQIDLNNNITLKLIDGTFKKIETGSNNNIANEAGEIIAKVESNVLLILSNQNVTLNDGLYQLNVPYGKKIKVSLPDNTLITLNSGSQLKFPSSFLETKSREVFLEGEAYFDVMKNKKAPFIVHTMNMDVRVLGTRFNVSSYDNDDVAFVALEEGSVAVNKPMQSYNENTSLIITPGEQVVFKEDALKVQKTNISKDIAWSKGELFFENDRFEDIIKELERHYNITIENNSKNLNDIRYTGTFTNETLTEVFDTFNELSEFNYKLYDEKIVISTEVN